MEFLLISEKKRIMSSSPRRASISHALVPVLSRLSRGLIIICVQKKRAAVRGSFLIGVPSFVLPQLMIATGATYKSVVLNPN